MHAYIQLCAACVLIAGMGCQAALPSPSPVPAPVAGLTPAESRVTDGLTEKDPETALAYERILLSRNRARAAGQTTSAEALDDAAASLLRSALRGRSSQQRVLDCAKDRDTLNALFAQMMSKLPEPGEDVKPMAIQPVAPLGSDEERERRDLEARLRALARRLDAEEQKLSDAASRARLEHARQTLLDATHSATRGMYVHAARLVAQAEALLASKPAPDLNVDDALRSDARRLLGDRVRLVDSGVLVRLGQEKPDSDVADLTRLLAVYRTHPVTIIDRENDPEAAAILKRILERTRTEQRAVAGPPELPLLDGTWLWIGFHS